MRLLASPDLLDRRALALVGFVDPLGAAVTSQVALRAEGLRCFAKRPGLLVITEAQGLATHATAFEAPPALPVVGSVAVVADILPADPRLAPRRATIALPRDPDPAHAAQPGSIFQPVTIALAATPLMPLSGLVAGLAVTLRRADDQRRIEGAIVRLQPAGGRPEVRAVTDAAGDALLLVPGVPLASPGAGAVVRPDLDATLDAIVDPARVRFNAEAGLDAARAAARSRQRGFIDPDDPAGQVVAATPVSLRAGRLLTATLAWTP